MIYDVQDNRLYFAYSRHRTYNSAACALDDYYASGDVCEGERPYIKRLSGAWCVMFPAE